MAGAESDAVVAVVDEAELLRRLSEVADDAQYQRLMRSAIEENNVVLARLLLTTFGVKAQVWHIAAASIAGHDEIERMLFEKKGVFCLRNYLGDHTALVNHGRVNTLREMFRRGYFEDWTESYQVRFLKFVIGAISDRVPPEHRYVVLDLFLLDFKFAWVDFDSRNKEQIHIFEDLSRDVLLHLIDVMPARDPGALEFALVRASEIEDVDICLALSSRVERSVLEVTLGRAVHGRQARVIQTFLRDIERPVKEHDSAWKNQNAMDIAIRLKYLPEMRMLLEYGYLDRSASRSRRYVKGCIAVAFTDGLRLLFEHGGARMLPEYLLDACSRQHVPTVRALLHLGADPDATTFWGKVFFRWPDTVCHGNRAIRMLLQEFRERARAD